jgi:hypothetical protein
MKSEVDVMLASRDPSALFESFPVAPVALEATRVCLYFVHERREYIILQGHAQAWKELI